jgi:hypothetical protein
MSHTLLKPAVVLSACLFGSQAFAVTYNVTANASANFSLQLGYLVGQEIVYIDPDDGTVYYEDVFLNGQDNVTINGALHNDDTFVQLFGANAQSSSDPTALNETDGASYTFEVTNTNTDYTVQGMAFDIATAININGGLTSDLEGYTQIDGNAFVTGNGLSSAFSSIFEEVNCTAAIAPCSLGDSNGTSDFGNGNFTLAPGESVTFTYTVSASTTVVLPDAPAPVPLPASGLLLGAGLMAAGFSRRRKA